MEDNKKHIELLEKVAESFPFPFYIIDAETYDIRMSNPASGNWTNKKCYAYTHGREAPCKGEDHPCGLKEAIRTKQPVCHEHLHYRFDGTPMHVEVHTRPVLDEHGNVPIVIEYVVDISKRREVSAELAAIYKNVPIPLCVIDGDRRILHANKALAELTKTPESELIGKQACGAFGCIHAEDDPGGCGYGPSCRECSLLKSIDKTLRSGETEENIEKQFTLLHEGEKREIIVSATTSLFQHNGSSRLLLSLVDVTSQRQKEGQYRILSQAIEQSPVTVVITDENGTITYVNPKFSEITGYSPEEAIGKNPRILKDPAKKSSDFAGLWETITSGRDWHGEFHNRTKEGEYYWENAVISPVKDSDGRIRNYIAIKENITELKKVREDLVSNEERLRLSQEYANIGTWDWDIQTGELYWSDRIAPLFGYSEGSVETTFENFMQAVHPEDREAVSNAINSSIESGNEYHVEHRCVWPEGSVRWLEENGNVLRDENGAPRRMLGMVQDITERKQAEQLLLESREEARRANRAKSEFLSSMSHELRTPMNAILGFAQLLEMDEDVSAEHLEYISEIKQAGSHLLDLINEVLDLSKIEAGRVNLNAETVRYSELIEECLTLLTPLAERKNVTIIRKEKTDYYIFGDRLRLKQIIINLLSNAIKYNNPEGSVWVRTDSDGNRIRVSVIDNGPGISPEKVDRMFEPFDRLGAEMKEVEGTGIGLTISKKLIEMMSGRIGFSTEAGKGTTFWIEIPKGEAPETEQEKTGELTELFRKQEQAVRNTVLYIEDNPSNLRLVEEIISKQPGIKLIPAQTASVGLELAEVHRPDLLILDLNLPELDGFGVLEKMKTTEWGKNIPAVAISANAMPHDIKKGKQAGFSEYLTKPLDVVRFIEILEKLLPEHAAQERNGT